LELVGFTLGSRRVYLELLGLSRESQHFRRACGRFVTFIPVAMTSKEHQRLDRASGAHGAFGVPTRPVEPRRYLREVQKAVTDVVTLAPRLPPAANDAS
jgi:hypothetical protein